MKIDVDFDVFKALTALRNSESDSISDALRRLLVLPPQIGETELANILGHPLSEVERGLFGLGVWFGSVHFPEATKLRATYKGRTYWAEIKHSKWLGEDGVERNSPSDAAGAISGTNVNGWRFWHAQRPGDLEWHRLDSLKI
jgi:hypothetical protein